MRVGGGGVEFEVAAKPFFWVPGAILLAPVDVLAERAGCLGVREAAYRHLEAVPVFIQAHVRAFRVSLGFELGQRPYRDLAYARHCKEGNAEACRYCDIQVSVVI